MTIQLWIKIFIVSVILTLGSYGIAVYAGWMTKENISWLEVLAVLTSYVCTISCVHQTRWNYPIGVVTTFLYSWLFYNWEMYGVALFNLYLVFSLTYGWFRWGTDEQTRPVTSVEPIWWLGYTGIGIAVYGLLWLFMQWFHISMTGIEIWITVLSGVAQFLLDNKKIETWVFWAGVNLLSIWFFFHGDLYLVAFQYIFFLANTVYGYVMWRRSCAA